MGKMICFDMDGTIADLYGVPGWLEALENEDPSPYLNAEPLVDMERLRKVLINLKDKGWEIRVISWLAKDSSEAYKAVVRQAKKIWLDKYKFPCSACHLVQYGTTKADCVRGMGNPIILVDDNSKVRRGWSLGDTIDPADGGLITRLEDLL